MPGHTAWNLDRMVRPISIGREIDMTRKIVLAMAALGLVSLLFITVEGGTAGAADHETVLTGTVICKPASGVWSGTIQFSPALVNGGTATGEKIVVSATLGNSASPCISSPTGIAVAGTITGNLGFSFSGANNCSTIFSGSALPAPVTGSKFKMTWTTPSGSTPTNWKQPSNFNFKGAAAMTKITIKNGSVTGSFAPFANPKAVLSDVGWPTTIASGCASSTGLSSLTLGTSSGKW